MRQFLLLILISALLLLVAPGADAQDVEPDILEGIDEISEMIDVIKQNYHEDVDAYDLVESAIRGMMSRLDPHSNYISPEQVRQLQSQQQGEYYGVGMTVGNREGRFFVVQPQPGGPAESAGLRAGDEIMAIDGNTTAEFEYQENVDRLRGPRGTEVRITVKRPGFDEMLTFVVVRDKISLKTVPYAFMLNKTDGYIRVNSFNHATHREVREELLKLLRRGMDQLILDLRSNPGGDLDASVGVADLFLDEGKLLYTKGVTGQKILEFSADPNTTLFDGPLVVLINSNSASGAEVVTGALQDHDRAWVVGEKSWGKGLVQTQFPLEYGALLSLTTAKYYTPSGRLIQKPYEAGNFEAYFNDDTHVEIDNLDAAMTDMGRVVYGGNGIMPDQLIPSTPASPNVQRILGQGLVFNFVNEMLSKNPEIDDDFYAAGQVMKDLRTFLKKEDIEYEEKEWQKDYSFLAARITLQTHTRGKGAAHGFEMVVHTDKQLQQALKVFDKAKELLDQRVAELGGS